MSWGLGTALWPNCPGLGVWGSSPHGEGGGPSHRIRSHSPLLPVGLNQAPPLPHCPDV